jgi:chemotaxis protein MotB
MGRPRARLALFFMFIVIGLDSFGCVTRGRYRELEADREALATERTELVGRVEALEDELAARAAAEAQLSEQLEATLVEAAAMQATYDQLVGELESEVAQGQIQVERVLNGIRLAVSDELLFSSGSATLDARGRSILERVARQIASEQAIVSVEGHTDDVRISRSLAQRYPTNWELAGARAAVVVRVLSENGVDPTSLRAVSRGPYAPRASNDTPQGRAQNRRTEILLRPVPTGR